MAAPRGALNEHPFQCQTCLTRWPIGSVRYIGKNCASCATTAEYLRLNLSERTLEDTTALCANCSKPFGHRRIVLRSDAAKVHYRCPTVTRAMRHQLANAPP